MCSTCGAGLPDNTRFCPACGAPATDVCPSCGETVQPGERFCRSCGTQVASFMSGRVQQTQTPTPSVGAPVQRGLGWAEPAAGNDSLPEIDLRSANRSAAAEYRTQLPGGIDCPRCGARAGVDDSFCNSCGLPFDEQGTRPAGIETDLNNAGLLVRLVARVIDGIILSSIMVAIFVSLGTDRFFYVEDDVLITTTSFYIVGVAAPWIYHAGLVALWATTPGKRVMGIHIEPVTSATLGFGRPVLREAVIQAPSLLALTAYETAGALSPLLLIVSVIIALSRPDRRMLHDLVAGTAAVRERR